MVGTYFSIMFSRQANNGAIYANAKPSVSWLIVKLHNRNFIQFNVLPLWMFES